MPVEASQSASSTPEPFCRYFGTDEAVCCRASLERTEFGLRLLQTEVHGHLAEHRCCGAQLLSRVLILARVLGKLPDPRLALGLERAHLEPYWTKAYLQYFGMK